MIKAEENRAAPSLKAKLTFWGSKRRRGRASTRRLDYLAGLIPEFHGVIFVVTDANQARPAEIAARYLCYMANSGNLCRFIANIAPNPAIQAPEISAA